MLNNYYLLRKLAHVWDESIPGAMVTDAWCQAPGELIIALEHNTAVTGISFLTHAPIVGAFRREDVGRPRRNTKSLLRALRRQSITRVRVSEGDRILILEFTGGLQLQAHLYGSQANVLLGDEAGRVQEAFRKGGPEEFPQARTAPEPKNLAEFTARWDRAKGNLTKALQRIYVRFNRDQAREVMTLHEGANLPDPILVYEAAQALHLRLLDAHGPLHIYQDPPAISLIPLAERGEEEVQKYSDIDEGLRAYAQRVLSARAYRAQYEPLRKNLVRMLDKAERSAGRMKTEQSQASRADKYERIGHILMASPPLPAGASRVELEDVFHPGTMVAVSLDPALNSLQNAERYYSKARKARTSRAHLDTLIKQAEEKVVSLQSELAELEKAKTYKDLKAFQKGRTKPGSSGQPFRRYVLASSYELWVGRNARESELLTLRHARPFDVWFHARGVSGAHAVLRLPKRDAQPSSYLIEQAAAIAAWHSKARTSSIAPVIVTPKKYVRKVRGTPLGEVAVSREEVVMVEPALP